MVELVNLRPLFPGSDQLDQINKICEILGDPSDEYGLDMDGSRIGGGPWVKGIKLADSVGFQFTEVLRSFLHGTRNLIIFSDRVSPSTLSRSSRRRSQGL